ncbi:hypothetical protein JRQ81_009889, partial [Phrynocephalus forsythii]
CLLETIGSFREMAGLKINQGKKPKILMKIMAAKEIRELTERTNFKEEKTITYLGIKIAQKQVCCGKTII